MPLDCRTLFVKGLPYNFKEDDVGDRFRRFGEIKAIRLAYNWQTKQSKGFAYITFETHDSAKQALLKMNGKELQGRQLRVDFDVKGEGKSSYKVNLNEEKNRLYNREPIKLLKSKAIKKEREKQKLEKIKSFTNRK
jgi:RNA recognition motif-containing protein